MSVEYTVVMTTWCRDVPDVGNHDRSSRNEVPFVDVVLMNKMRHG
jgi:hypothetical protein